MNDYNDIPRDEIDLLETFFPFIVPKYLETHDIMTSMLDFQQNQDIRVADLGVGFGDLAQRILQTLPTSTVFGIDNQEKIVRRAKTKLQDAAERFVPFVRDLNDSTWMHQLRELHAVVSSFTLDYLPKERHQQVIAEAYKLLLPMGRMVSCEFFKSYDSRINRIFHDLEMSFIQQAMQDGNISKEELDQLSQSTLLRQDHHVCTLDEKIEWLKNAGFELVEVPWRFLNIAVVSAVRRS